MKTLIFKSFVFICLFILFSFSEDCGNSSNACACNWNNRIGSALSEYRSNSEHCAGTWAPLVCMTEADQRLEDAIDSGWGDYMNC
ncbi:MAG: hypothetical protein IPL55_12230 [Saprospiraceae bacterium]|jgi:hypothetical protein|nr:hypothetical protein [Saprospiraceae bacterium]